MKAVILFAVLISSPTIHGLSCIAHSETLIVDLRNLDRESFMMGLDKLAVNEDEAVCKVSLIISYAQKVIHVEFSKLLGKEKLSVGEVVFFTHMAPDENGNIELANVLKYACSKSDNCERHFLLNHIEWLLTATYSDLVTNSAPLIVNKNGSPGKCSITHSGSRDCVYPGICVASWSNMAIDLQQDCVKTVNIYIEIGTFVNLATDEEKRQITFTCNYNECNNLNAMSTLQQHMNRYYDLSSLYKALHYNSESVKIRKATNALKTLIKSQNADETTTKTLSSSTSTGTLSSSTSTGTLSSSTSTGTLSSSTSTGTLSSATVSKSCCSSWRFKNTMMGVVFGALWLFLLLIA